MKGLLRAGDGGASPRKRVRVGKAAEYAISRFLLHGERSFWLEICLVQGKSSDAQRGAGTGFFKQKR
ncbi:TPA: hypothetical protein MIU51_03550 [Klebsiella pneumoniae]|nr:hypothetical protein [Klebsiella pneumoniae]